MAELFNKKCAIIFLIFLASILEQPLLAVGGSCPSQRDARKSQEARLDRLTADHVVIEAIYMGAMDKTHRFQVEQVWMKNNGSLKRFDEISVDPGKLFSCFQNLKRRDAYLLMLRPVSLALNQLRAIEAPVPARRKKHRQAIWESLCAIEGQEGNTCDMRITLPPNTIFYRGSMKILQCKVESSFPVTEVTWFKSGINIDTELHTGAGLYVDTSNKENSYLMIRSTSHAHNGNYSCKAKNSAGQTAIGKTKILVIGPQANSIFIDCNDPHYCLNGGICRQYIDKSVEPMCQCAPGYEGRRCQGTSDDFTAEGSHDSKVITTNHEQSKFNLVIVLLSASLVCVVVGSILYIVKLRRRLSPREDEYDVVGQYPVNKNDSGDETKSIRYTSTGNGAAPMTRSRSDLSSSRKESTISSSKNSPRLIQSPLLTVENEKTSNQLHKLSNPDIIHHADSFNRPSRSPSQRSRLSAHT